MTLKITLIVLVLIIITAIAVGWNFFFVAPPANDLISVSSLKSGDTITSPLLIAGMARGPWYFEASFPIELLSANGEILAVAVAQAQSEWMTEEFVPFLATLEFKNSQVQNGKLVLKKDNPSGLPEHDDQLVIPVVIGVSQ